MSKTVVVVKCIACARRREVQAGEVPPGRMPMCEHCHNVMVVERVERKP